MTDRYAALRRMACDASLDAIALVPGANFARLFNASFHQNERPLVVVVPQEGAVMAIVPSLELQSFAALAFEGEVFDWTDQRGYQGAFDALMQHQSITRLGVEGQVMRVFIDQAFRSSHARLCASAGLGLEIVDMNDEIARLRVRKTPEEIAAMRRAVYVTEAALSQTVAQVRVGMTEVQIRRMLMQHLFAEGAEALSFSPIVAAGTQSAQPHAHSRSDYGVRPGDALLIDCGARVDGVCADMTRTFFVHHASDEQQALYQTVLAANGAGLEAAQPGASAGSVDHAATAVLEASAFADFICHKTGHGLGRDIHEAPWIMRGNEDVLQSGMIFTVEPGLYDSQCCGVRIEDDVLITEAGHTVLTTFDKSLTVVG